MKKNSVKFWAEYSPQTWNRIDACNPRLPAGIALSLENDIIWKDDIEILC